MEFIRNGYEIFSSFKMYYLYIVSLVKEFEIGIGSYRELRVFLMSVGMAMRK